MSGPFHKNYVAGGAIAEHRILKFDAVDDTVVQAAAATDSLLGVSDNFATASGERIDVQLSGIARVQFAGIVVRGGPVTADADGKGVAAAPATGVNNRVIGYALVTTAAGDIADVLLAQGSLQG